MRNLVLILIAFIAVITFIRALDDSGTGLSRVGAETAAETSAETEIRH
jgi:hypothetical protein